jgi:hypothetical protein
MSGRSLYREGAARNPRSLNSLQVRSTFGTAVERDAQSRDVPARRNGSKYICRRDICLYRTRDDCSLAETQRAGSDCHPARILFYFPAGTMVSAMRSYAAFNEEVVKRY